MQMAAAESKSSPAFNGSCTNDNGVQNGKRKSSQHATYNQAPGSEPNTSISADSSRSSRNGNGVTTWKTKSSQHAAQNQVPVPGSQPNTSISADSPRNSTNGNGVSNGKKKGSHATHNQVPGSQPNTSISDNSPRNSILRHIHFHQLTFLQGETGCGKSTLVPQYILDYATAQGRGDSVRVIVAQPRRLAAVSLARYVAKSRGQEVGYDVGFAVKNEKATSVKTRLTYVTTGYLLSCLAHESDERIRSLTHIILDEVHVRSVEQDLLLLLLKLKIAGTGNSARSSASLRKNIKLIIMSATMEARPLQEYFRCLLRKGEDMAKVFDPIFVGGRKFPLEIVHIDEMLCYLPEIPGSVAELATRLVDLTGSGERALDGTNLPRFAVDLVSGLVRHVGQAGDTVLVFVASLSDILEIQQSFQRYKGNVSVVPVEVDFLHSMQTREEQEEAIEAANPGVVKVILATNIAESSLSITNVRVVIDLGHHLRMYYNMNKRCLFMDRMWCSKASLRQRAGRAGRLYPGVVFRLFSRETFENIPEFEKPDIAVENLGSSILQMKCVFQSFTSKFSVSELLQQLLDSPTLKEVSMALQYLQDLGAIDIVDESQHEDFVLKLLGRMAVELQFDPELTKFVLLGLLMGCGVDCVVMAAGASLNEELFHRSIQVKHCSIDPLLAQERMISNAKARLHFDGGCYSELLSYRQIYQECIQAGYNKQSLNEWLKTSQLQQSKLNVFLTTVRDLAWKMVGFLQKEMGRWCNQRVELTRFTALASIDSRCFVDRRHCLQAFCSNIAILHCAIAGAFSHNLIIGSTSKNLQSIAEIREFEEVDMLPHLSFKLQKVPSALVGADTSKLEDALQIVGPVDRVVSSGRDTILVQCAPNLARRNFPLVIENLPSIAQIAGIIAKSYCQDGKLILYSKENVSSNAKVEELYVGKPSGSRTIGWTSFGKMQTVAFNRLSLVPTAIETRKDVAFHIAVAVNIMEKSGSSGVTASSVTVLPQEHLFSVLTILMFRPLSPEGNLQVRILSRQDSIRVYSIRFRSHVLDLAPRFICLKTLNSVSALGSRIHGFMAGNSIEICNLLPEMINFHQHLCRTKFGAPILAPDIGPWLEYPSLSLVEEKKPKPNDFCPKLKSAVHLPAARPSLPVAERYSKPKDLCHELELNLHQPVAVPACGPKSCPILVQSRKDLSQSTQQKPKRQANQYTWLAKAPEHHLLEHAFAGSGIEINRKQLLEWMKGEKAHNGIYFDLIRDLIKKPGDGGGHRKALLEFVYPRRNELVNKKQRKELEGWYHSICNPDLAGTLYQGPSETKSHQSVELHTQTLHPKYGEQESHSQQSQDGSEIIRQLTVNKTQRDSLVSAHALQPEQFAAKISFGSFSAQGKSGLVMVSGKHPEVEKTMQWIHRCIHVDEFQNWIHDDTYFDTDDWQQMVRCVVLNKQEDEPFTKVPAVSKGLVEFMLIQQHGGRGNPHPSYGSSAESLYHTNMTHRFDEVLHLMNPADNVQLQVRLGRVIFQCTGYIKNSLPFGESKPVGTLRPFLGRHTMKKRRFNDSIPEIDFYRLRACLHLCHPQAVTRRKNIIVVAINPTAMHGEREEKFELLDSLETPGRFHLQGTEKKRRLAAIDIVRLKAGVIEADVRISMQTKEKHELSEEAHNFVRKIVRTGSKLEFPEGPYIVQVQRHKDAEIFQFEGFMVSLIEVKQIGNGVSLKKYEVEFEAVESGIKGGINYGNLEMSVPLKSLTSRIPVLLQQVQSVCSQMSWMGPSNTSTALAQSILRSWSIERKISRIKEIFMSEFPSAASMSDVVKEDGKEVSLVLCNIVEMLSQFDGRLFKEGLDLGAELQLVVLQAIGSMNIWLSNSVEGEVKQFLASQNMEPENALQYACLFKCHCSSLDWSWDRILRPYLLQLILEQREETFQAYSLRLNIRLEFLENTSSPLFEAMLRCSVWTTHSALAKVFQRGNVGSFLKLFHVMVTYGQAVDSPMSFVKNFVRDLLSFHDSKAAAFVYRCLEWTLKNKFSDEELRIYTQNVLCLLHMLEGLDVLVNEVCRAKVLDLLLRLPSSMERKRELEEVLLQIYGVDETEFRNCHYQRILQQLGRLTCAHLEEMKRRGLNESHCAAFNFQAWYPGKLRGRDVNSSSLIPGVNEGGNALVGKPGIFIPARDPHGRITGGQIKADKVSEKGGKYIWLSSHSKTWMEGKGPHIKGGLPLFCCVPKDIDTSTIGMCEGGLKAHVLAALSGLPVIGASGGDFTVSKDLLESYLAMMDVEQVIFFPDAGSQRNDNVIRSYFRTFRLLRDWGYKVLVAWWGQISKEEHEDIDDYLASKICVTELPLLHTYQFWQILDLDVQSKLQEEFPEYDKSQAYNSETCTSEPQADMDPREQTLAETDTIEQAFTDVDGIKIARMSNVSSCPQMTGADMSYQVTMPKDVMIKMPEAPNDHVTPSSVATFTIEVLMVQMNDLVSVNAAVAWLLPESEKKHRLLGLDCEHGLSGDLNLIQLSTHQRCILIRLSHGPFQMSPLLAAILEDKAVIKSGAEVQIDALAIYTTLGIMANKFINISSAYKNGARTKGMLEIFRNLYGWEWNKKKDVTRSDWGCTIVSLQQVKYATLDAWTSRMIALEGPLDKVPITSLADLPVDLLNLFARAITTSNAVQRKEKTIFETTGSVVDGSESTLRLLQHSYRSRVMGKGCKVEFRFNDGQKPAQFEPKARSGKSVVLTPLSKESSNGLSLPIDISSIGSIVVDNSKHRNAQDQKLREIFYQLLCHPNQCPQHLSLALKSKEKTSKTQSRAAFPKPARAVASNAFEAIFRPLNDSQREALTQIFTSPLSATIGPPGTGKTRLITAIARAWSEARDKKEVLLCSAYQNVAARHMAEALAEEQVNGVLMLVSEDYFVDWHENLYGKLGKAVVITKSRGELPGALEDWRARNKRHEVAILICTLALVGSPAFSSCLMGGKVTAMVIEECSQASEGSCINPLACLPDLSLLTVLGDPHQLPPFGSGDGNKVHSIFDLVANGCEVKLLREQYRMPPTICDFISFEIYNSELLTAPSRSRERDWPRPLVWVNVPGVAARDPGNPSAFNALEADAVVQFCQNLMEKCSYQKRLVVLTLYEEQNRRISKLLAGIGENLQEKVEVHNVDSFQGQQSDVVLISLVAGKRFSPFAADRHRACVISSRVKRFLCVFGNHDAVRCNPQADIWWNLARFCEARNFVISQPEMEPMLFANLRSCRETGDRSQLLLAPPPPQRRKKTVYAQKHASNELLLN